MSGMGHLDALLGARAHARWNRDEVAGSFVCGCFRCQSIFTPLEIVAWTGDGETALCPHCDGPAVIGDASGYPITPGLLQDMRCYWCEGVPMIKDFEGLYHVVVPGRSGRHGEC